MKTLSKITGSLLMITIAFFAWSCDPEEAQIAPTLDLSAIEDDIIVNQAFEDLDNITLQVLQEDGLGARKLDWSICEGAVLDFDESGKKVTLDFGSGCTSYGITRKGKVNISYSGNLLFPGSEIVINFENYEVNDIKIEGRRTLKNNGIDILNSTIALAIEIQNGKATWPDNTFITITSNHVRQLVLTNEGYDAFITGTMSGKSRRGVDYSSSTGAPLVINQSCVESGIWIPNSGILNFDFQGIPLTVDFGAGTCDKTVTISSPSGSEDRVLD